MKNLQTFFNETWRHAAVMFAVVFLLMLVTGIFTDTLRWWEQILVVSLFSFGINAIFEWYQEGYLNGNNTMLQKVEDCISASVGGVLAVIIYNLIF